MQKSEKESGIAWADCPGAEWLMFEHIPRDLAEELDANSQRPFFVVEAVNWTFAGGTSKGGKDDQFHYNRYVIEGWRKLARFLSWWNREMGEVAEDRVGIRFATAAELAEIRQAEQDGRIVDQ